MITWERCMDISALRRQGFSFRAIAKRPGIHRNTVKKLLQNNPPHYTRSKQKEPILTPYLQLIDQWLQEDDYRASWIFNQIQKLGYTGGYDTVRHYVRKVKDRQRRKAFIRFETIPGLQGQMDWADFQVAEINGFSTLCLFLLVLTGKKLYAADIHGCPYPSLSLPGRDST